VLRGALAGAVAGLVASWAMESFQASWTNASEQIQRQRVLMREGSGRRRGAKGGPEDPAVMDLPKDEGPQEDPSTVKVASAVAEPILDAACKDVGAAGFTQDSDIAKVSLIGAGMRSHPGVAADMFEALAEAGINIEIISTSSIRISCVVRAADVERAVQAVHERFQLFGEERANA